MCKGSYDMFIYMYICIYIHLYMHITYINICIGWIRQALNDNNLDVCLQAIVAETRLVCLCIYIYVYVYIYIDIYVFIYIYIYENTGII
jgi:hypothetical protein